MRRLTIYREGEPLREHVLSRPVTALGRHTDNDVVLDDLALSRFHARLEQRGEQHVVVDLASQNGVYVNGVRVTGEQVLRSGDRVGMGRYVTVYDEAGAREVRPPAGTMTATAGNGTPAPEEPESPAQGPYLMLLYNGTQMERFPLRGQGYVIGRSHQCDIVVGLLGLSRRHAQVTFQDGGWVVEDLASQNGTFVNDRRITGPQILRDGDSLNFFEYALVFHEGSGVTCTDPVSMRPDIPAHAVTGTNVEPVEDLSASRLEPVTDDHDARAFESDQTDMEAKPLESTRPARPRGGKTLETPMSGVVLPDGTVESPHWPVEREIEEALLASMELAPGGRLEVLLDKRLLTEVPLDRAALRIGSDARCDVALPPVPGVTRWHLAAVRLGGTVMLCRVGTSPMPRVGGRAVAQAFLQDGELVELGRVSLVYRCR
jgi:pSer/pThr/pTyr-binding forkhead associated (FHA) protein